MKLLVLTMGGTIDAEPYPEGPRPEYITASGERHGLNMIRDIAGPDAIIESHLICDKDSKNIDDIDLANLEATIKTAKNFDRIIVTIGTDRMTDIARHLETRIEPTCPVIFTGAIRPLSNGAQSDGQGNLRLAVFNETHAGVYIAMSGLFDLCAKLRKDNDLQKFVYDDRNL